ncbi:hypothetical protein SAMN06295912_102231 [Sphingomonas laterariae]|uniref:Phosphatidate cytidylyltransferase n=1 Tax=Edaphosphingomonas laterariae TaxID=861865 RepID=A0A239CID5_9SPHN|nr:hypothetical protein [Sphingomonas laterariae]SNS19937.1 hypothetical protein SAMN06295912_102231 [Sphingomonas laterariae]
MDALVALVAAELGQPVDPRAAKLAAAIAARYGGASRAVLFYGSCLRETRLDGLMLDFYLIVSDYRAAYGKSWLPSANRLIPPNVFPFEADGLAAKYAVLSEADFARLCSTKADNVSVWARFAQPSRLVWSADEAAAARAVAAVAQAAPTLLALAAPTRAAPAEDPLDLWRQGFTLTYGAELRAERGGRPGAIVDADPDRYRRFSAPALAAAGIDPAAIYSPADRTRAQARWRALQRRGKALTLVRLAKASATFAGGIDYLAWKINRHAGTAIAIKPWQRRWPLLGAMVLLPRLLMKGAVR